MTSAGTQDNVIRFAGLLLAGLLLMTGAAMPPSRLVRHGAPGSQTFGAVADAAVATLERAFYHPPGRWNVCLPDASCGTVARDWGADSLAEALFVRWRVAHDSSIVPIMTALAESTPTYNACRRASCTMWSDIPMWDAIADAHAFEVTGNALALEKARRAFALVDTSDAFALGACPSIAFQRPRGGPTALKTLETDSNYIKAALLLHRLTGELSYLQKARDRYAAVRRYYLDPKVPLYSVYVFDDGAACKQLPRRFFASVNGNMIANGLALTTQTGDETYRADAIASARAVVAYLSDASGIYADLQAENDVAQPLVEAMYDLAADGHFGFARDWLIAAAAAAQPAASGAYGRFFAGPAPRGPISAWSSSGGLTLAIVAGVLEPERVVTGADYWSHAQFVADDIASASARIEFTGRAIALIGTIGEVCCEAGHVGVLIDGRPTFNNTGIWQNKSSASRALRDSVLLSWRWPSSGRHTIAFAPGTHNAKEGGSYIHLAGYEVVP